MAVGLEDPDSNLVAVHSLLTSLVLEDRVENRGWHRRERRTDSKDRHRDGLVAVLEVLSSEEGRMGPRISGFVPSLVGGREGRELGVKGRRSNCGIYITAPSQFQSPGDLTTRLCLSHERGPC